LQKNKCLGCRAETRLLTGDKRPKEHYKTNSKQTNKHAG
jgi:hypothetical protein